MRTALPVALLSAAALALGACGYSTQDRALSGAAIGGATGAAAGAIFDGTTGAVGGALLGAGVGAAAGALTDGNDVQLGDPIW
jgi:hypothetical protein